MRCGSICCLLIRSAPDPRAGWNQLTFPWKYRMVGRSRSEFSNMLSSNFDLGGKGSRAWYIDFGLIISLHPALLTHARDSKLTIYAIPPNSPRGRYLTWNSEFYTLSPSASFLGQISSRLDVRARPYLSALSYSAQRGHGTQWRNMNLPSAMFFYRGDLLFLKPWDR